jgi:simple sugar transport system permease protein
MRLKLGGCYDMILEIFTASFFQAMLVIATPVLLASMGEVIGENTGMLNIGLPGMMLLGASSGFMASYFTGSPWLGLVAAVFSGVLFGIILGYLTVYLKLDQILAGFLIMLLSLELATFIFRVYGPPAGTKVSLLESLKIPLLSDIPFIGQVLFDLPVLTYVALILVPVIYFFLFKTRFGLAIRTAGENPMVLDTAGGNPRKTRLLGLIVSSGMAGLAGGFLTTAYISTFYPFMIGGRGWIAIAMVFFGKWNPRLIFVGVLIYSFAERLAFSLQAVGVPIPESFLVALPYIFALLAFVVRKRGRRLAALGKNY